MKQNTPSRRWALRDATDAHHRRLDARLTEGDVASLPGYRTFLAMNRTAFAGLVDVLKANGDPAPRQTEALAARLRLVEADLCGLGRGAQCPSAIRSDANVGPREARAFALGIAYVTEGARLGSRILLRRLEAKGSDELRGNARYLRDSAADEDAAWPDLLAALDEALADPESLDAAVRGAIFAFETFERALDQHQALRDTHRKDYEAAA